MAIDPAELEAVLQEKLPRKRVSVIRRATGGLVNESFIVEADDGEKLFVKGNRAPHGQELLATEVDSLEAIRKTNTITVPETVAFLKDTTLGGLLVLRYVEMRPIENAWYELGRQMAALHRHNAAQENPIRQFGFHVSSFYGNYDAGSGWTDSWEEHLLNTIKPHVDAILARTASTPLRDGWPLVKRNLHRFFADERPFPSLLHGDFCTINFAEATATGAPIVFDPSSSYGHDEMDLCLAWFYGDFSPELFRGYFSVNPKRKGFEQRQPLYELYARLVYWNLDGDGHRAAAERCFDDVLRLIDTL